MCTKNMAATHSFLGLKIVPQIIEEMNDKGKALSISRKDAMKEDVFQPIPQHPILDSPSTPLHTPSRPIRRLRPTTSLPPEREAGLEILDILLSKVNSGSLTSHYLGSPPLRAGNPLIHDAQFCQKRALQSPVNIPQKSSPLYRGNKSPNSSLSCGSKSFVRIEGFIPSNGESHQGIPAFA